MATCQRIQGNVRGKNVCQGSQQCILIPILIILIYLFICTVLFQQYLYFEYFVANKIFAMWIFLRAGLGERKSVNK